MIPHHPVLTGKATLPDSGGKGQGGGDLKAEILLEVKEVVRVGSVKLGLDRVGMHTRSSLAVCSSTHMPWPVGVESPKNPERETPTPPGKG